jgi:acetyl esterase/lipase
MPWLLFAVGGVALCLTANAWRPVRAPAGLALVSFFAGWLTTELALHHVAWQLALLAIGARFGALASWPGWAGAAAIGASCAGLVALHVRASHAGVAFEEALRGALGDGHAAALPERHRTWLGAAFSWRRAIVPFALGRAEVETIRGVPFGYVAGRPLRLDVHRPRAAGERRPTLVYVHGGGWVLGFRERQGLPMMRHLAAHGWVCFSIDYRLSPRATFPDHLVDVKRALAWVREHAEEYGADPDFVVLCGNSAGAHLASLAALTANDARYQPGFEHVDTRVSACVACYGIYDFTDRFGHWPNGGMRGLLERVVMKTTLAASPEAYAAASPIDQVHADAPPFLVVHGDRDTLAPTEESRRFAAALRAVSGAPVAYAEIRDAQHAFEVFSSPRTTSFLEGSTAFLAHVHAAYEAARAREEELRARTASGFVAVDGAGARETSVA